MCYSTFDGCSVGKFYYHQRSKRPLKNIVLVQRYQRTDLVPHSITYVTLVLRLALKRYDGKSVDICHMSSRVYPDK